jgi:hypothetical protein
LESGGGGKPLGKPPGRGEEGAIDVVWRSFIQMMKRILFGILNAKRIHSIGARERFASWKERARAREERRILFGKPSLEEEKTQETLAPGG